LKDFIKVKKTEILSNDWGILNKVTFDLKTKNGDWEEQSKESYNTGDGATVLLYNPISKKVVLTRQFRLPTYLNGNKGGFLTEACAGLLDNDPPMDCAIKEAREETGYDISNPQKIFEAYMSPGAVTEIMHFFIAEYSPQMKVGEGGGANDEHEDIEVIELDFNDAWDAIGKGEIKDAKTIMLLQHMKLQKILG
jgi:nudix-type nucleoside diphosphatase (YffH/AdpP family)